MKTPISVHALFHKDNSEGQRIYKELYKLLCRDIDNPFSDGLDIPVYYATGDEGIQIKLADSSSIKRVVLLFIDINMFCSQVWREKITELMEQKDENTLIVGVKQYRHAFSINKKIGEIQSIIVDTNDVEHILLFENDNWDIFTTRLFDLLIRFVTGKEDKRPITVFISHSKQGNGAPKSKDGENTAKAVRDFLYSDTKLNSFFDVHDILDGYKFGEQIKSHAGNCSLLILFTDSYSTREWCRIEALTAKENHVPIVAVFMMQGNVDRIFPYIGNIPSTVFDGDWRKVINLLLRTTLDQAVEKALLSSVENATTEYLPYPPEAFNMSLLKPETNKVLYPEPPLGNEELEVLDRIAKKMSRDINFCTPMSHSTEDLNLQERQIGISVAESADIANFGIGEEMFKDLIIELTRHILKANGSLIYGGDLRSKGYTELFRDLARQYGQKEKAEADVYYIRNYLHWPVYNNISVEQEAEYLASRIDLKKATPGSTVLADEKDLYVPICSLETNLKWATSLTQMRLESIGKSDARIISGGKTVGFTGFMPGIAEEFMIAYNTKKPIYLIGGFGGCSHVIAKILEGKTSGKELLDSALKVDTYKQFYEWSNANGHTIDYSFFDKIKIEELNNGLRPEDNLRLLQSVDIIEVVSLILTGLKEINK